MLGKSNVSDPFSFGDSGKLDSRAAWHGLVWSGQNKIDADPFSSVLPKSRRWRHGAVVDIRGASHRVEFERGKLWRKTNVMLTPLVTSFIIASSPPARTPGRRSSAISSCSTIGSGFINRLVTRVRRNSRNGWCVLIKPSGKAGLPHADPFSSFSSVGGHLWCLLRQQKNSHMWLRLTAPVETLLESRSFFCSPKLKIELSKFNMPLTTTNTI